MKRKKEQGTMGVRGEEKDKPKRSRKGSSSVLWHRQCLLSGAWLHRRTRSAHTDDGNKDLTQSLE